MNIERRGLLQMLGLIPTLGMVGQAQIEPIGRASEYHGWTIDWSGWMRLVNQRLLVGRWVAVKRDSYIGVYSGVPGGLGYFLLGQFLDTSVHEREGQMYITPETTVRAAEIQKQLGLTRLLKFLENPPPIPEAWRNSNAK